MIYLVLLLAVIVQSFAGFVLWRLLRPQSGWVELAGMSVVIGTLLAVFSGIVLQPLFGWGWALPGLVALIVWALQLRRSSRFNSAKVEKADRPLAIAVVIGLALAVVSFGLSVRSYPLNWEGSWGGFHGDMAFFEALSRSIPTLGVFDSIFTPGQEIHYHWLAYAWTGQLTTSFDAQPFLVLTRVLPVITLFAGVTLIAAWTRRLSRVSWAPTLAVILLLLGGHLGIVYGSVYNFDSPSQSLSVVWLIGFVLLLLQVWGSRYSRFGIVAVLGLVGLFSAGFMLVKVSTAAVAAAVLVAVVIWQLIQHRRVTVVQAGIVIAGLVPMAIAYFVFLAGGNGGGGIAVGSLLDRASSEQGMNPTVGIIGVALGTGILALGIGVRWVGTLWLATDSRWRARPEFAIGIGLVVSGVGAAIVLNGGQNELWFAAAAAGPLAALSSVGVGNAWECVHSRVAGKQILTAVAVVLSAVVVYVVVWVLWASGPSGNDAWIPTLRWLGPIAGLVVAALLAWLVMILIGVRSLIAGVGLFVLIATLATAPGRLLGVGTGLVGSPPDVRSEFFSPPTDILPYLDQDSVSAIPAGYLQAGEFLRSNSADGDLVATNLTFSTIVPALSGVQTLVSGTGYQTPYGPAGGEQILLEREVDSYGFINAPSVATVAPLCEAGVRWVWIDPNRTGNADWSGFLRSRYEDDSVIVGELDPALC